MTLETVGFASKSAARRAEEMGLAAADFRGLDPEGENGWTVAELDRVVTRKDERQGYRVTRWRPGGEDDPGHPNYECLSCGFAHLDEQVARAHVSTAHR